VAVKSESGHCLVVDLVDMLNTDSLMVNVRGCHLIVLGLIFNLTHSPTSSIKATLSQRWIQKPLVFRDRDERPKRTLWQCTVSVCVAGVHCWEISLGLADPWNMIFCLSCRYILGFSCMYLLHVISLVGFLFV